MTKPKAKLFFYLFCALYATAWTVVPTLLRNNLPMDALEGYVWGQNLEWGYDRNPWLNAWLTHLAIHWDGYSGWLVYAFSQVCVFAAFWSVWKLSAELLSPLHALLSVLLLSTLQYYNLAAVDFNDNVLELGLWALAGLNFYWALQYNRTRHWLLLGLILGLGLMAKYYTAFLMLAFFLFLIWEQSARATFKNPKFYGCGILILLICLPHLLWLPQHHYLTITYALNRTANPLNTFWVEHFWYATQFLVAQGGNILILALITLLLNWKTPQDPSLVKTAPLSGFQTRYLSILCFGPLLLTFCLAILCHWQLHIMWGTPLLTFWPLFFLSLLSPELYQNATRRCGYLIVFINLGILSVYAIKLIDFPAQKASEHISAQQINTLCLDWEKTYHQPLKFVIGDRYSAGMLAYHCPSHPNVLIEGKLELSPWISLQELKTSGALLIAPQAASRKIPAMWFEYGTPQHIRIVSFPIQATQGLVEANYRIGELTPQL